jgi:hypothetical protein
MPTVRRFRPIPLLPLRYERWGTNGIHRKPEVPVRCGSWRLGILGSAPAVGPPDGR